MIPKVFPALRPESAKVLENMLEVPRVSLAMAQHAQLFHKCGRPREMAPDLEARQWGE
jgi:hypothetical protein